MSPADPTHTAAHGKPPIAEPRLPAPALPAVPFGQSLRTTLMTFWGVVVPVVFLGAAAAHEPIDDVWQSGELGDYALLLYRWPSLVFVYPLLVFAGVALARLAWRPDCRSLPWVLAGVLTGAVLWLELTAVWVPCTAREFAPESVAFVLVFLPLALPLGALPWLVLATAWHSPREWKILSYGLLFLVVVLSCFPGPFAGPLLYFFACLVWSAPAAATVYAWASWVCVREQDKHRFRLSLKALMAALALFSYHLAAWRVAVNTMLQLYAATPTEQPSNCYVATAAARGHARLVGSRVIITRSKQRMPVTLQLQRLKAAELALLAASPRVHRMLRAAYDHIGRKPANCIKSRWLADLAYVGLKPCEWASLLFLKLAGVRPQLVERLYHDADTAAATGAGDND